MQYFYDQVSMGPSSHSWGYYIYVSWKTALISIVTHIWTETCSHSLIALGGDQKIMPDQDELTYKSRKLSTIGQFCIEASCEVDSVHKEPLLHAWFPYILSCECLIQWCLLEDSPLGLLLCYVCIGTDFVTLSSVGAPSSVCWWGYDGP